MSTHSDFFECLDVLNGFRHQQLMIKLKSVLKVFKALQAACWKYVFNSEKKHGSLISSNGIYIRHIAAYYDG